MGALMRARDWSATSLGDPSDWPQSLRTTVRLALNTRHPIFIFWGPELICFYNDAYRQTLDDARHPRSLGAPGREVWDEIWHIIGPQIDLVMSGSGATWHEDHLVPTTRFGTRRDIYWTYSYSPIDDDAAPNGVGGVLVICNDVTEQHANRERLARSEERFRDIFENTDDFVLSADLQQNVLSANAAVARALGYAPEELIGRNIGEFITPAEYERTTSMLARKLRDGGTTRYEVQITSRDGRRMIWEINSRLTFTLDGVPTGLHAIARDVTEQHRTQIALRESRARLALAMDSASLGTWEFDPQTGTASVSDKLRELFGADRSDDGLGFWFDRVHAEDRERVMTRFHAALRGEEAYDVEFRVFVGEELRWARARGRLLEGGSPARFVGIAEDITSRKRIEDALRISEERLGLLWDSAQVLLNAEDPNAMLEDVFARIAGHLEVDAYLHFIADMSTRTLHAASYGGFDSAQATEFGKLAFGEGVSGRAAESLAVHVVTHIQATDDPLTDRIKQYGFRAYAASPLMAGDRLIGTLAFGSRKRDEFGADELEFLRTVARYVAVAYERLQLIAGLREADRRKDEFLATLAHELRNPLAPIRQAARISKVASVTPAQLRWSHDVIERQVQHMALLLDDLLDVSRITRGRLELRREVTDLASIIDLAVETANPTIEARRHQLAISMPRDMVLIEADTLRLAQVISNLLTNAAKYTDIGGKLQLIVERVSGSLIIRVLDNGIGIDAQAMPRLFDMFSQVDSAIDRAEGGLGIGLALVKGLVELHGGTVAAYSAGLGHGSEFVVRLPIDDSLEARRFANASAADTAVAPRRILIADDNHDAAASLGMLLELSGHEIELAHDGQDALARAELFRPSVVLLDIGMPKLNGYEVAERIRREPWGRDMLLIAVTGWGQEDAQQRAARAGFDHHLTKPIDPDSIDRLLGA